MKNRYLLKIKEKNLTLVYSIFAQYYNLSLVVKINDTFIKLL